uniref:protein zer-1 homolog isoform X1 n=1 Tax=Myodes glareolus TaxID=447135 RepID=UPI00201FEB51|nr:protein zer-1 homolog isoform X1 [Myodes glareolus]XP_048287901.1 protein zer-1 homolog isoform X1 [Myodes glareolus]XP_048287902.1 protein zer-1 homolog isoform X1 [Myodes glareolus]XP_048287903.1 protein zer-1 homolog isoform X1 [Myodes glareolus]
MASDTPESLMALCTDFCLRNLDGTLGYLLDKETLRLHPDIFLPSEICDQLVNEYVELVSAACTFEPYETFFSLFSDPRSTRLTRIHLREDLVQDQDLEAIRKQDLVELYLTNCEKLSAKSLQTLRSFSHSLVSLSLFGCSNIFYEEDNPGGCEDECLVNPTCQVLVKDFTFEGFSRLRFLNLGRMIDGVPVESLLRPLNSLAALDLSGIQTSDATFLTQWKDSLMSLVLYNMDLSDEHIRVIVQLHKLRHLDISRDRLSSYYKFKLTRKVLSLLVQKLGNLMSLDISGHMILENCSISKMEEEAGQTSTEPSKSSIMPFRALKRPLQFLGLFETSLCRLTHIPAYKVSGDKNEEQVLNAIEAYTEHRPEITSRAINLLFDIARIERCNQLLRALKLVITALKCHKYDKNIQVTGSAALFYLTNSEYRSEQSVKLRRQVIQVVLNGMESYQEVTVQRNCCLTLCNFSIPEELEFQYRRVNELLLSILSPTRQDESIQRIAVHLCNALVCQVDNDHKEAVGKMGFVVTMLKLIQKKLLDKTCDQVMEFSWSALWNITDETPDNCEMFLSFNGMKLFLDCLKEFPEKQELHRNMLGLLGNVAEVKELRPQLMTSQFISVFSNLLESKADGIEVSYNACGVLSHIMFDGPEAWGVCEPQRAEVEERMWAAIQSWDINSRRNINYRFEMGRSFEPILRLLPQGISPVSQHWATWALYNLVSVYPDKYCPLLIKEGGMPLLRDLIKMATARQETKEMARKVIEHCSNFREENMDTSR